VTERSEPAATLSPVGSHKFSVEVTIRPACDVDLPLLEWSGEFWHYREKFRSAYVDQLAGCRLLLVADLNNYPVGRIAIVFSGGNPLYANGRSRAYLYSLQVMTFLQGMSIGSRLLDAAEDVLRQRGFRHAIIAAAVDNQGAQRLYQRRGYVRYAEDPGRWSYTDPDGVIHQVEEPCWLMKKNL
jgi:ribosomal protein S18 acetylase RimI-like enzyme